jgi:hypothetical protein
MINIVLVGVRIHDHSSLDKKNHGQANGVHLCYLFFLSRAMAWCEFHYILYSTTVVVTDFI